jgi:hypothetical protein
MSYRSLVTSIPCIESELRRRGFESVERYRLSHTNQTYDISSNPSHSAVRAPAERVQLTLIKRNVETSRAAGRVKVTSVAENRKRAHIRFRHRTIGRAVPLVRIPSGSDRSFESRTCNHLKLLFETAA